MACPVFSGNLYLHQFNEEYTKIESVNNTTMKCEVKEKTNIKGFPKNMIMTGKIFRGLEHMLLNARVSR